MSDLKPMYDRVLTAQSEVGKIRNQMVAALALGTTEGEDHALALEATLDAAIAEETKWSNLYNKLVSAEKTTNVLQNFVPANASEPQEPGKKTMKRTEWKALNHQDRRSFITAGGLLED